MCRYISSYNIWPMLAQVSDLHEMLSAGGREKTVPIYVDSWGIKRLATLAMRRWKAPIATYERLVKHAFPCLAEKTVLALILL